MGCPSEVQLGAPLVFSVDTHDPGTSAAIDADALPTYRVYEDQTQTAIETGAMAKLDDPYTTGFYSGSLDCTTAAGYEIGKTYTIYIAAIVGGITGTMSFGFKVAGEVQPAAVASSPSEVAICNLALVEGLGDQPITSLDDDSNRARSCKRLYPECRDELLVDIAPGFAVKRVALALLAKTPVFDYSYAFQIPTDCLHILETDFPTEQWRREGDTLVSYFSTCSIKYLARITDTTKFSPPFTRALVAYLTARLCFPITKSASMTERMWQLYQATLEACSAQEGQEGVPRVLSPTTLLDVRRN